MPLIPFDFMQYIIQGNSQQNDIVLYLKIEHIRTNMDVILIGGNIVEILMCFRHHEILPAK
jgi:hypothetical protein